MRRAAGCEVLIHDEKPYGILLNADYVAEHEYGISGINHLFGLPNTADSFNDVKITRNGSHPPRLFELVDTSIRPTRGRRKPVESMGLGTRDFCEWELSLTTRYSTDELLTAAFDSEEFIVRGFGSEGVAIVQTLADGFAGGDIAIWMSGSSNPFGRGGLVIARYSMVPAEWIAHFNKAGEDRRALEAADKATGIKDRLKEIARTRGTHRYFALKPAWASEKQAKRTAYPIVYWLNPWDQQANSYGWFTVEELDQWIAGEGPIPIRKKSA